MHTPHKYLKRIFLISLFLFFFSTSITQATTYFVGTDFVTIQAAIDAADEGDTIVVPTGTYQENICFRGKILTLTSTDPNDPGIVENTIIDGGDANSVVTFAGTEDANCLLTGFTITNGKKGEMLLVDIQSELGDCDTESGWTAWDVDPWLPMNLSTDFDDDFTATLDLGEPMDNGDWQTEYPPAPEYADAFEDGYTSDNEIELTFSNLKEGEYDITTYHWDMEYSGSVESSFYLNDEYYGETLGRNASPGGVMSEFYSDGINDVVLSFVLDEGPVIWLNGFALKAKGNSNTGGGIAGNGCAATISKCIIEENWANYGGGVAKCDGLIQKNIIRGNQSDRQPPPTAFGVGGTGGGLYDCDGTIIGNKISYNNTWFSGGGMMACDGSILNNLMVNNTAIYSGGLSDCDGIIKNCTLVGHWNQSLRYCQGTISNNVVYTNRDPNNGVLDCNIPTYCCIENWTGGGLGNISCDPCFVNAGYWDDDNWIDDNADYHLQSVSGRWDPNTETWVKDANTSYLIDAGNPGCSLADEPIDANNVRINMGAYGGTAKAGKTPEEWRSIADLTNNWAVDANDLDTFVDFWLGADLCVPGDLNRSSNVDFLDFNIMANYWQEQQ